MEELDVLRIDKSKDSEVVHEQLDVLRIYKNEDNKVVSNKDIWEEIHRKNISCLAYEKWQAAGSPECDGVQFWLEAEKEYDRRQKTEKMLEEARALRRANENKLKEKNIRPPQLPPDLPGDNRIPWQERIRRVWGKLINP